MDPMIESLFWMAAGAAFYRFFPGAALAAWRSIKGLWSRATSIKL